MTRQNKNLDHVKYRQSQADGQATMVRSLSHQRHRKVEGHIH